MLLVRVLTVNAGSTSLKLHIVEGGSARSVDEFEPADAVGHRVVHGGTRPVASVPLTADVERDIERASVLAPLQNARSLEGIRAARMALPEAPQVAVFDSGFHATMPQAAATYAVPEDWRQRFGIRRLGFHGINVQWVASQVEARRLVVCHLGGGCSVTAVLDGRSVDTTMGFTPLEGIPMATRSGSFDPGAIVYLLREGLLDLPQLERDLEHRSGLAGLSGGLNGDIREASSEALDVFVHRVAGAVAAMATACRGVDHLAFTGGIGEHAADVRDRIEDRVRFLGDFAVSVVPAREELVIAAETESVVLDA
jgi:acetate kinase